MFRVLFPLIQRSRSVKEVTAMFASGDTVMHPTEGVCLVEDVRTLQFGAAPQPYYVLHPTGEKGSSTLSAVAVLSPFPSRIYLREGLSFAPRCAILSSFRPTGRTINAPELTLCQAAARSKRGCFAW